MCLYHVSEYAVMSLTGLAAPFLVSCAWLPGGIQTSQQAVLYLLHFESATSHHIDAQLPLVLGPLNWDFKQRLSLSFRIPACTVIVNYYHLSNAIVGQDRVLNMVQVYAPKSLQYDN